MRRRVLHAQQPVGKINVTPLIDVVMCLIVFYLIVGKLAADRQARIELPGAALGAPEGSERAIVINIMPLEPGQARPRILIGDVPVAEADLDRALSAQLAAEPNLSVQLRADRSLDYGAIAPVIEACRRTGLASVRLATERSR